MNVPRPQGPTYNQQSGTWQQTSNSQHSTATRPGTANGWTTTSINVEHQSPTQTIIHEEGALRPDRNYNHPMFNTPLAPLAPGIAGTSTSTIVYAQPVGSQEDSQEVFDTHHIQPKPQIPYNNPQTHRQNFTRHIHYTSPGNMWVPVGPTQPQLVPSHPQVPTHLMPPLEGPVDKPGLAPLQPKGPNYHPSYSPHRPQYPSGSHIPLPVTTYNMPPVYYPHDDRGQSPLPETSHTVTTINVDNLPGIPIGFDFNEQEPVPSGSRKVHIVDDSKPYGGLQPPRPYAGTASTQRNSVGVYEQTTQIPKPSEPTSPIGVIPGYPKLSNATIQTFPNQPHYSYGYSEVAHSRNTTNSGRKIPQHSAIKPTNQGASTRLEISKKSSHDEVLPKASAHTDTSHADDTAEDVTDPQNLPLKEALQLMLRPYLNRSGTIDDDAVAKAQSHIMNLVSPADTGSEKTTTTHNPLHPTPLSSLPSTTPHQDDVELIIAGEQNHLVSTSVRPGGHETTSYYETHRTTVESQRSTSADQTHTHNSNWHKHHQHNPSSSKIHTHEFHDKHPHLPNPFAETHHTFDIDIRSSDGCPFNCGNGRCIQQHEVSKDTHHEKYATLYYQFLRGILVPTPTQKKLTPIQYIIVYKGQENRSDIFYQAQSFGVIFWGYLLI